MLEPDGRIETMTMEPVPLPTFGSVLSEYPSGATITACRDKDKRLFVYRRRDIRALAYRRKALS